MYVNYFARNNNNKIIKYNNNNNNKIIIIFIITLEHPRLSDNKITTTTNTIDKYNKYYY
jgi:hypothetical protein